MAKCLEVITTKKVLTFVWDTGSACVVMMLNMFNYLLQKLIKSPLIIGL